MRLGSETSLDRRASEAPSWPQRLLQGAVRALWLVVIPALLAAVVLRFLVPLPGPGLRGAIATVGRSYPVAFWVGLFLSFSAVARYWRFPLPGGRYATDLPAHVAPNEREATRLREWEMAARLVAAVSEGRFRRDLERAGDPQERAAAFEQADALAEAVNTEDLPSAKKASVEVLRLAAPAFAARRRRSVIELAGLLAAVACAVGALRVGVAEPYQVVSSSMIPVLQAGDRVMGRKVHYAGATTPRRGEIIAFRSSAVDVDSREGVPDVLLKRVIGLPGDRIAMADGVPVINGWTVPMCKVGTFSQIVPDGSGSVVAGFLSVEFLGEHAYLTLRASPIAPFDGPYIVQPGEVFVLGDNRNNSIDSRAYRYGRGGGVPLPAIEARADRFLAGTDRSGEPDLSGVWSPLGALERGLRSPGPEQAELERGIRECLGRAPEMTSPPVASQESAGEPRSAGPT